MWKELKAAALPTPVPRDSRGNTADPEQAHPKGISRMEQDMDVGGKQGQEVLLKVPVPGSRGRAHQKAFHVENPAPRRGRLTARPSGKFWIPIPMAKFLKKSTNKPIYLC